MAKYYSGQDGKVFLQGQQVAKVRSWQLTLNTDALETTVLSVDDREFTTGLRSATGSMSVLYYDDAPVKLLEQVMQDGVSVGPTARLVLGFDNKFFEFDAVLTSADLSCVVGDVMQVAVQFQRSGALVQSAL